MKKFLYGNVGGLEFCLIYVYKLPYLVSLELLTQDSTIKDYLEWEGKWTHNAISICEGYIPQTIKNGDIESLVSLDQLSREASVELGLSEKSFGSLLEFDFRDMLIHLYNENGEGSLSFWTCRAVIKEYLKDIMKKVEPK